MTIRKLELKDAPLMLEWMHDPDVTGHLAGNFASRTIKDAQAFITAAQDISKNLHMAIVNDDDEYMGTVSLKHIDMDAMDAEFAIAVRRCAMGKGYSWAGMEQIIRLAFDKLGLKNVYWCVSVHNVRACRFYDKHGFKEYAGVRQEILDRYKDSGSLKWYAADCMFTEHQI